LVFRACAKSTGVVYDPGGTTPAGGSDAGWQSAGMGLHGEVKGWLDIGDGRTNISREGATAM